MALALTKTPAKSGNIEAAADAIRRQEAKNANRLGDYSENLKRRAQDLLLERNEAPGAASENSSEQIAAMNVDERQRLAQVLHDTAKSAGAATQKFDDLKVGHSLSGTKTMGQAMVGQGRGSVEMNSDLLVEAHTENGKKNLLDTGGHEVDHAEKQGGVIGPLKVAGTDVKKGDLNEAKSEFAGGREVGRGETQHRANQPQDYAAAQKNGIAVKKAIGEVTFNELAERADTLGLQKGVWQSALNSGSLTLADVLKQGADLDLQQSLGYHDAAHQVAADYIATRANGSFTGVVQ